MSKAKNKPDSGSGEPVPEGLGFGAPEGQAEVVSKRKRPDLDAIMNEFVRKLELDFPARMKRRPQALKSRVLRLLRLRLPPYPKPVGRPPRANITRAVKLFSEQQRKVEAGLQRHTNWRGILVACAPEYSRARSDYRRQALAKQLRDAVYARLARVEKRRGRKQ